MFIFHEEQLGSVDVALYVYQLMRNQVNNEVIS